MLVVFKEHTSDIFAIQVFFPVGSAHESKEHHGLSHFLEHMMFKSKKYIHVHDLLMQLNSLGGTFNAITSKDFTSFYIYCHKDNWELATNLLYKITSELYIMPKEFENEQKIIIEEYLQYDDNIQSRLFDELYQCMLNELNPYRKNIKGQKNIIENCTPKILQNFYKSFYKNPFVYVNISGGGAQHRACTTLVNKLFDKTLKPLYHHDQLSSKQFYEKSMMLNKSLPCVKIHTDATRHQNATMIGFVGYPFASPENIVIDFLWDLLTGSLNSLLLTEIREKRGLVYGMSSFNDTYKYCGLTGLYFTSSSYDLAGILKHIFDILRDITINGIVVEKLDYAKKSFVNKNKFRHTTPLNVIQKDVMRSFYGCDWNDDDVIETISRINNTTIKNICKKVFDFTKICVLSSGHYKKEDVAKISHSLNKLILDFC